MSCLPIHTTTPCKRSLLAGVLHRFPGNRADSQRQRIKEALSHAACTSFELIRLLVTATTPMHASTSCATGKASALP